MFGSIVLSNLYIMIANVGGWVSNNLDFFKASDWLELLLAGP